MYDVADLYKSGITIRVACGTRPPNRPTEPWTVAGTMVILILERVSPSLRGLLTRWMIQPRAGVLVSKLSALVRDKLWERTTRSLKGGGAILIHSSNTEQGFAVRTAGGPTGRVFLRLGGHCACGVVRFRCFR